MSHPTSFPVRALAVLLLIGSPGASQPAAAPKEAVPARAQEPPPAKCCLTNPSYAGTCEVQPTKDETCASVLGYLNNPMSQGKGYCGNTTIRGGWKSVPCEPARQ